MLSLSVDLITRLRNLFPEKRFAITTNGTVCNPAIFDLIDHIVVSPKLKGLDPYWIHPGILDYFVQSKGYRPGWDMTSEIRITISQDYGDQEQQFEFVKKFLNSSMRVDLLSFSPVFDADVPSNWKPGQGHSDGYRVNLFSLDICEALVRKIHNEYFPQPARVSIQVHKMVNWR